MLTDGMDLKQRIVWLKNHGTLITFNWNSSTESWHVGFTDNGGAYHAVYGDLLEAALDELIVNMTRPPRPSAAVRRDV